MNSEIESDPHVSVRVRRHNDRIYFTVYRQKRIVSAESFSVPADEAVFFSVLDLTPFFELLRV